jgi:hypothetical protein
MTFLDVLRADRSIMIHTGTQVTPLQRQALAFLGIEENRLFCSLDHQWDHYAHMLIVPMGSQCGRSHVHLANALANELQRLLVLRNPTLSATPRTILIIKRTKSRVLAGYDELIDALKLTYESILPVVVFSDDSIPTYEEIACMFHRAHIIIAPHGAGLGNMYFTELHKTTPTPYGGIIIPVVNGSNHINSSGSTDMDMGMNVRMEWSEYPALIELHDPLITLSFADLSEVLQFRYLGAVLTDHRIDIPAIVSLVADLL